MEDLESQIAKIQLGNIKHTSSYVFVLAEKSAGSDAEIYIVAELPLLNPAAQDACEKICLAISSSIKRVYRKPLAPDSFENAIAQVNEELGKLASLGQVYWINKLNCIIGVKTGETFTIASCGKISAFLFRNREFTDISCSPAQSHPLKTFENFAAGKIRLNDLLILSTTQLFNYLSMDRVKNILQDTDFLTSTQTIIELLKENAGPDVAFGTILNLQVPEGQTSDEEFDLENFLPEPQTSQPAFWQKSWDYVKTLVVFNKIKRTPQTGLPGLPKKSLWQRASDLMGSTKTAAAKGRSFWSALGRGVSASRRTLNINNFRQFSPQKKFLMVSVTILLIAFITNLAVASHLKKVRQQNTTVTNQLKQVQTLLANAQTSLLYQDENGAKDYFLEAQAALPQAKQISKANQALYNSVLSQLADLEQKTQKEVEASVSKLGSLSASEALIKLPDILAAQTNGNIISFNKTTGRVEDGNLKASDTIIDSVYVGKNVTAVYTGKNLRLWDPANGALTQAFSLNVPETADWAGLAVYSTNSRVYLINKKTGQVLSFLVSGSSISKPVVAVTDASLSGAKDLAIDGAIYVLSDGGIKKYLAGRPADFKNPLLIKSISGNSKIYTEKTFNNIYVLDAGNNRILIFDKKGGLVATLKNSQFTKLADFQVDETGKVIYVLNDSSLLKVTIP